MALMSKQMSVQKVRSSWTSELLNLHSIDGSIRADKEFIDDAAVPSTSLSLAKNR